LVGQFRLKGKRAKRSLGGGGGRREQGFTNLLTQVRGPNHSEKIGKKGDIILKWENEGMRSVA